MKPTTKQLSEHTAKAFAYIRDNPHKTAPEIALAIGYPTKLIRAALRHATKRGEIVMHQDVTDKLNTTYTLGVLRERILPKPAEPKAAKPPKPTPKAITVKSPKTTKLPYRKDV